MQYNNSYFSRESTTYYDEGLRVYMLSIYRNMSMALSISALLAYTVLSHLFSRSVVFTQN